MSVRLILYLVVLGYGVWYTLDPMRSLKRKYREDEVPKISIMTARIIGVVIILVGIVGAVHDIYDRTI